MGHPALAAVTATDPTIRNLLAHPAGGYKISIARGYKISIARGSTIRQVPTNPSLRVQAA